MSKFNEGDRVRVEYEGVVTNVRRGPHSGRTIITTRREGDDRAVGVYAEYVTVIEPVYEKGAVYQDAAGELYYRLSRTNPVVPWRHVGTGQVRTEDHPVRPLRKLVPEPGFDEVAARL